MNLSSFNRFADISFLQNSDNATEAGIPKYPSRQSNLFYDPPSELSTSMRIKSRKGARNSRVLSDFWIILYIPMIYIILTRNRQYAFTLREKITRSCPEICRKRNRAHVSNNIPNSNSNFTISGARPTGIRADKEILDQCFSTFFFIIPSYNV